MTDGQTRAETPDYKAATQAQAMAADPAHSAWVSANAGSGKTKVLIDRVARLLLKKARPDSILCITYTKAAANEMLQRLFDRLGSWSVMDEAPLRVELAKLEGRKPHDYESAEIAAARALFAQAVETPGGLRIETIHAFCARVLRQFPLEARVHPGFAEIDEIEAAKLWQAAVRLGLQDLDKTSPEVLDAVSVAGGSSGAMAGLDIVRPQEPLIERFLRDCEHDPDRIGAALKEALAPPEETEERLVEQAMGAAMPVSQLRHVMALCEADKAAGSKKNAETLAAVLAEDGPDLRWETYRPLFFTGGGDLRKSIFVKAILADPVAAELFLAGDIPQGSEVQRILALDAAIKARRVFERTRALLLLAGPVLSHYGALKRARAVVDFDDLIALTRDLLTVRGAADWVLYKLDGGLTHVLLDEAQDTSPDQWELINALTAEFHAGAGAERSQDPRTLFVVGDEKQSIYSFQGADPQRFIEERQAFEARVRQAAGAAFLPNMDMSFRSSPEILAFVDAVSESGDVATNPYVGGPAEELNLMRHTARRSDEPGMVELWPIEVPVPHADPIPWDAPRDSQSADEPKRRLARQVAAAVRGMVERGETVWKQGRLVPMVPGDVLILVQKRKGGLFDGLISALKAEGLPVAGADRLVLASHIGVQDCLNLMRFVLLPEDDLTLAEIIRGPFGGFLDDDAHLFPLAYERGDASLWSRLCASPVPEHRTFAAWLGVLQQRASLPPFEFLSAVLDQPGEDGETGWQKLTARLGGPVRDPVTALMSRAMAHDAQGPSSLQLFLAAMELDTSEIKRDLAAAGGEVRVMTVHGAKGLQAPVVILPDTTPRPNSLKPGIMAMGDVPVWRRSAEEDTPGMVAARDEAKAREAREQMRLLYVAMTRAEDRLILCGAWSGKRPKAGETEPGPGYGDETWYALLAEAIKRLVPDGPGEDGIIVYGTRPPCRLPVGDDRPARPGSPDWLTEAAPDERRTGRVAPASGLGRDRTPVVPPSVAGREGRLKRGRLIHALLERLPALPPPERRAAGEVFLGRDRSLTGAERADMLAAAFGVLEDARFAEVFAEGGRAEAAVIGTAPSLPPGLVINGRVDRLVVTPDRVLIIDYKTDRPPPARAEEVARAYLLQMAAYRAVLAEAWPGRKVEAALVWTDGPVLMPLPGDLLEESLSQASVVI